MSSQKNEVAETATKKEETLICYLSGEEIHTEEWHVFFRQKNNGKRLLPVKTQVLCQKIGIGSLAEQKKFVRENFGKNMFTGQLIFQPHRLANNPELFSELLRLFKV